MPRNCAPDSGLRAVSNENWNTCWRGWSAAAKSPASKGNRYIQPREADLVPGRIRMNRQGKGFLQPDDPQAPEIRIPEDATGTAMHEDRVLVRRDVRPQFRGGRAPAEATGTVVRILERRAHADRRHAATRPAVPLRHSR